MEFSIIAGYENIPEGSYVIKVKNILAYIHYDGKKESLFIDERMVGCFVCCKETAEAILEGLNKVYKHEINFELVSFKDAYDEMKLIQRQLKYN